MTSESEEFAQFTQSLLSTPAEAPAETPQPEAPKVEEPAAVEPAAEDKPAEPKAEEPKPEDKKPEDKPVDWKELAAKERERRAAKAQAKAAQAQREREYAEAKAKAEKLERIMSLSKEKRLAALEELGITVNDVNDEYIRGLDEDKNKPPPAIAAAQKELAEIRAELKAWREEKARIEAESATKAAEAQRAKIQTEYTTKAAEAIKAKADDYELLSRHPKGSEVVFHFIAAHYAQTATIDDAGNVIAPGEELDINEACRRVEAGLVEQFKWTADVKKLRGSTRAADSTTLAGDVRQPPPPQVPAADDDSEFKQVALRLLKQQAG